MNTSKIDAESKSEDAGEGTPVCIKCFRPVDPLANYCSHCGGATGNFTHYLPFVNIRWQASVWGQAWRQTWSRDVSIPGRLFRAFMIIWNVPIMLIGVCFRPGREEPQEVVTADSEEFAQSIGEQDV